MKKKKSQLGKGVHTVGTNIQFFSPYMRHRSVKLSAGVLSGKSHDSTEETTCTTSDLAGLPCLHYQGSMQQLRYTSVLPEKGTAAEYHISTVPNLQSTGFQVSWSQCHRNKD